MLASFWGLVPISLAQGLVYGLIAVAMMVPFRMLNLPDLSCEGTFPFGACVAATAIVGGVSPVLATVGGAAAGALAGVLTAQLHLRLRVHSLLAGILVLTMLWSINLRIMGRSNLAIFGTPTVFDLVDARITQSAGFQIGFFAVVMAALLAGLRWFMGTELGLGLRGVGGNAGLAPALGLDVRRYTVAGLAIANGIAGLAGALVAQLQGYADVSMGFGVLVNGLAGLILGEAIIGRRGLGRQIAAPCVGALMYYQLVSLGLALGLQPSDLRLVTGLFVVATLAVPVMAGRGRAVGEAMS